MASGVTWIDAGNVDTAAVPHASLPQTTHC